MKPKVLIVDDDLLTLKILQKHLQETYEVQIENEGYRFVEKMDSYDADLILLDMDMPILNGIQVFDSIRANPKYANTPVAFLSGVYNPELVHSVMSKGASGYIVKTLPRSELLLQIGSIMSKLINREVTREVLAMDSDIDNLKFIKKTLEEEGFKAKVVVNVIAAIEYLQKHKVAVFIIGRDAGANSPEYIEQQLSQALRFQKSATVYMNEQFTREELVTKVRQAVGE